MKYDIQFTNQFKKDLKLAKKQNKNLDKLFEVIDILANGGTLEAKYRDHDLTGNYKGTRECHIEPDWLLIYEIQNNVLILMLYRLGTHSELFKKQVLKTEQQFRKHLSEMISAFLMPKFRKRGAYGRKQNQGDQGRNWWQYHKPIPSADLPETRWTA